MASLLRQTAFTASKQARCFSTTLATRKDLVQELYLKELRAYKPAPQAKDAHLAHVKQYAAPAAPRPPTLPTDLASELAAYDSQNPHADAAPTGAVETTGATGAAEFLAHLEADIPHDEAHH